MATQLKMVCPLRMIENINDIDMSTRMFVANPDASSAGDLGLNTMRASQGQSISGVAHVGLGVSPPSGTTVSDAGDYTQTIGEISSDQKHVRKIA
jgi:hypothetical protein